MRLHPRGLSLCAKEKPPTPLSNFCLQYEVYDKSNDKQIRAKPIPLKKSQPP